MTKEVFYCGECHKFRFEDTDDWGWCAILDEKKYYGDMCVYRLIEDTDKYMMPIVQAERVLKDFQAYRLDKSDYLLTPKAYTAAVNTAIRALRRLRRGNK